MTRAEHIQWCKNRALAKLDANGNVEDAYLSMSTTLQTHEETAGHTAVPIGLLLLLSGQLSTPHTMRKFINGFK